MMSNSSAAQGDAADAQGSVVYLLLVCFVAALGGLLFGYDTAVISGAIKFLTIHFALSPAQLGWAAASALAGCMLGAALAGAVSDRFGRKRVLILCAVLFLVSAVGSAVPPNLFCFVVFRILGGVGVGAASMTSPMYIAEIAPAPVRGRLVSLNQLAIVSGMLIAYFVNYAISSLGSDAWNTEIGWRWMFAAEAVPAIAFLALLFPVPESPRWLTKQDRTDEALDILSRVNGKDIGRIELASIKKVLRQESGQLSELFSPRIRMVLMIGITLAVLQQVTGINVFLYFGPRIFEKIAESNTGAAMLQTVVVGAVNLTFTILAIWTVDRVGRKPLMLIGYTGMGISLLALGQAAYVQRTDYLVLTFMLLYIASFALSVGAVTWVILSEIFPTKIRGRAMALATVCLWGANFIVSQTFPIMDENAWLVQKFHHAFPFWVYAAFCLVAILFLAYFVPETKGRSLEEIEQYWYRHGDKPASNQQADAAGSNRGGG
jgi:sugar porter (SP) family MFS transporter